MYIHLPSLTKLSHEVATFIGAASAR